MDFWNNILRYPRFFFSSLIGLILVLISPVIRLSKEVKEKKLFFLILLFAVLMVIWILNQMINPSN